MYYINIISIVIIELTIVVVAAVVAVVVVVVVAVADVSIVMKLFNNTEIVYIMIVISKPQRNDEIDTVDGKIMEKHVVV